MKFILQILLWSFTLIFINDLRSEEPYTIEIERINMPGTPSIHSFAFAESNGKWLIIGGRTNGLHGFDAATAFPKQYANKNIFVIDPQTLQTWSRSIFTDLAFNAADPLRSTNMQFFQSGNKLYMTGGYGFDSASNSFITFPVLTVIDVAQTIEAVSTGQSIAPFIRQITDNRIQMCGGSMDLLGEFFYLSGGHNFTGSYNRFVNNQVYSNEIRKFKINDDGSSVSISDYSAVVDTVEYHRRDMNVVPAIKPDGVTPYLILYGGVFIHGSDLPYLNPIYIENDGISLNYNFSQKMSQYTCSFMSAFSNKTGSMHTTMFGGMSLYYYNEITQSQQYDSLVPFIDDITTITNFSSGVTTETISAAKMPALLGTNSKFILDAAVPKYDNAIIKLDELSGRTFAGYIYGGIRAMFPNNTPSFPSEYVLKVYITPKTMSIRPVSNIIPGEFSLSQNYPNPFNPSTKIKFDISAKNNQKGTDVKLIVYNTLGEVISELLNEELVPGKYEIEFDGHGLTSGIYFYKLETAAYEETKKMILLK